MKTGNIRNSLLLLAGGITSLFVMGFWWGGPPETSSRDPRVDCARFKAVWKTVQRASEAHDRAFDQLRSHPDWSNKPSLKKTRQYKEWRQMQLDHTKAKSRMDEAIYVITKHLGYTQGERTRMWNYRSGGEWGMLYQQYFNTPKDKRVGDISWLVAQGLPFSEVYEFCNSIGTIPDPDAR